MKPVSLFPIALLCGMAAMADEGKFTIYMGGKPVASETYTVQKGDSTISVEGSGKAEIGPMKVDIELFKVVTDTNYHPVSATARATMGQMKMSAEITFAEGKAHAEINTGQGPQVKEDEVHPDDIVLNTNLPLFAWSVVAMRAKLDSSEPQEFRAYMISKAEVPITVTSKGREKVEFADKSADLNHLSASFATGQGQTVVELWVNDDRKIIKAAVPAQNVEAYQDGWARKTPPETPKTETAKPDEKKPEEKKP